MPLQLKERARHQHLQIFCSFVHSMTYNNQRLQGTKLDEGNNFCMVLHALNRRDGTAYPGPKICDLTIRLLISFDLDKC